jgi:hydrogenase maturation protease
MLSYNASPKTAILGFGNPVRSDDAIGVYVVNELGKHLQLREDISVFDMGTSAFEILFKLKGSQRMIIIDGVINSGHPDGSLFCLPASEIEAQIQNDPLVFLHGMKWDQALSYAKKMMADEFPRDQIQVYLIAISDTKIGIDMSDTIRSAGDRLVSDILNEVSKSITQVPKEAVQSTNSFSWDSEVYLEGSHICIKKDVAERVFGSENIVLSVFYARGSTFMVAPAGEELFKTIHKGSQQMLKSKNIAGDKSIPIHELLLDHEIDGTNRDLAFNMEEALHTLTIKL